jgi:hypothetical protein
MAFQGNSVCNAFKLAQWAGTINFATDTFKIALYTNSAALGEATAAYTSTGEVVASGYPAGGATLAVNTQPTASGTVVYMSFANAVFTAALTARGALIYKDGGPAVCVLDFGADKTSTTTFTVQFPAATSTSAILRLE